MRDENLLNDSGSATSSAASSTPLNIKTEMSFAQRDSTGPESTLDL
jgi:hypothetical protein